jgi:hypothetical protein
VASRLGLCAPPAPGTSEDSLIGCGKRAAGVSQTARRGGRPVESDGGRRTLYLLRTDPTDNGGLFIGRRPGTAPTRYRALPQRGSAARQRVDRVVAHGLLGVEVVLCLLFWGPVPAGALWLASRLQYWGSGVGTAIFVGFAALVAVLMAGLMLIKRVDEAWILVRRAAGVDQRQGAMGRVFAVTAAVGALAFTVWFLFINGPGSSTFSGQGG